MEVREFVAKALTEVLQGIQDAQAGEGGSGVNALLGNSGDLGGNLFRTSIGVFTRVDFDLAVTAEETTTVGGDGKLSVMGLGVGGRAGREAMTQSVSRVSFSVPVHLPAGDPSHLQKAKEAAKAAAQERQLALAAAGSRLNNTGGF